MTKRCINCGRFMKNSKYSLCKKCSSPIGIAIYIRKHPEIRDEILKALKEMLND